MSPDSPVRLREEGDALESVEQSDIDFLFDEGEGVIEEDDAPSIAAEMIDEEDDLDETEALEAAAMLESAEDEEQVDAVEKMDEVEEAEGAEEATTEEDEDEDGLAELLEDGGEDTADEEE